MLVLPDPHGFQRTGSDPAGSEPGSDLPLQLAPRASDGTQRDLEAQEMHAKLSSINPMDFLDWEILRSTSIAGSLRHFGRLWRRNPATLSLKERQAVYARSKAAKRFNVFLSHSWQTKGRWKILSLLFQCGWLHALICWLILVPLTMLVCYLDFIPVTLTTSHFHAGDQPLGIWVLLAGFFAPIFGLMVAPYVRCKEESCFIDAASIDQTREDLTKRGIRSIGGVLQVSDELRVLWSRPYLSRAWCVFELAVYRKGNPNGKLLLKPLFVEQFVAFTYLGFCAAAVALWFIRSNRELALLGFSTYALAMIPTLLAIHLLRQSFKAKHQLLEQFENFDLSKAECTEEADRLFIHRAIEQWYGSKEAFTKYVRGPLRQELMRPVLSTQLPVGYVLIMTLPTLTSSLEFLLALLRGGALAAWHEAVPFFVTIVFSMNLLLVPAVLKLLFLLCDLSASPSSSRFWDFMRSLAVYLIFMMVTGGGLAVLTSRWLIYSQGGAMLGAVGCLVALLAVSKMQQCSSWKSSQGETSAGALP